jgi:hypothetical protein
LAGERDPHALAGLRDCRIQASEEEIAHSSQGNWKADVLFELQQAVAAYDFYRRQWWNATDHIQMRTMLGPISLAVAACSSAGAISFRERSKTAISARRSISPSSLRRCAVASLDLAMSPPTLLIASDGKQIFGDHTPT